MSPIAPFLQDPDVSEIMVKAGGRVFLECAGVLLQAEATNRRSRSINL